MPTVAEELVAFSIASAPNHLVHLSPRARVPGDDTWIRPSSAAPSLIIAVHKHYDNGKDPHH